MKVNAYVKELAGVCYYCYIPFEKYKWTGRWKMESRVEIGPPPHGKKTIKRTLSLERRFGIFPFNLFWKVWENENNIVFREEETIINTCSANELL